MTGRNHRFRLAGAALVALLLCQSAGALQAHAHFVLPGAAGTAVADADPTSSHADPDAHGALDCRACRLRAEHDRHALPAFHALPLVPHLRHRLAPREATSLYSLWRSEASPARAPPVHS